jgi:hypothetical protein
MKASHTILCLGAILLFLSSCTSGGDSSSSWSRSYLASRDAVIDAVVDVLEDEDYLVDLNRDAGRIDAQPAREKTGRRVHLMIRVKEKKGRVQVDVSTRSQMDGDRRSGQLDEAPVLEFLHELDLRMQGIRD